METGKSWTEKTTTALLVPEEPQLMHQEEIYEKLALLSSTSEPVDSTNTELCSTYVLKKSTYKWTYIVQIHYVHGSTVFCFYFISNAIPLIQVSRQGGERARTISAVSQLIFLHSSSSTFMLYDSARIIFLVIMTCSNVLTLLKTYVQCKALSMVFMEMIYAYSPIGA